MMVGVDRMGPADDAALPAGLRRTLLWRGLQSVCRVLFPVLFDVQIWGIRNVPARGAAVIAANHQSYLDPPLVGFALSRPVTFLAQSGLFKQPAFAAVIRALHAFPIQQGKGDRRAVLTAIEKLAEGHLLNIYPEGGRSRSGEIEKLQAGIALIVRKARCPVVPTILAGAFEAWPLSRTLPRMRPIRIAYGPPLHLYDLPGEELLAVLERVLREMHEDVRSFPVGMAGVPMTVVRSPAPEYVREEGGVARRGEGPGPEPATAVAATA